MNNSLTETKDDQKFSTFLKDKHINVLVAQALGEKKDQFTTAIISAVAANPALAKCQYSSILSAAFIGAALGLTPSPQLGQFYLIPFKKFKGTPREISIATFVIGYKGLVQMTIKSGQYRNINAMEVKQGELISHNPFTDEIKLKYIELDREELETIGYYAILETLNGFKKVMYWNKEKMQAHAMQYSQAYKWDVSGKKKESFWSKDFDQMGCKTMLRQITSKWGLLSTDMQTAFSAEEQSENEMKNITPIEPEIINTIEPETQDDNTTETSQTDAEKALFG